MTIEIKLPFWSDGAPVSVTQQPGGETSHDEYLFYSWDFSLDFNHYIRAVADGTVVDIRESVPDGDSYQMTADASWGSSGVGNIITLRHDIDGQTFYSSYLHLKQYSVPVEVGDFVEAGDIVGQVGRTGKRDGDHAHVQIGFDDVTFGNTLHGYYDRSSENGGYFQIADARDISENENLITFSGYGATLPNEVIGPSPDGGEPESFNIVFDYSYDTSGFFDDPERRNALEAAADIWEGLIGDDFQPVPAGVQFSIANPSDPASDVSITLSSSVDDLVIFVGGTDLGGLRTTATGTIITGGRGGPDGFGAAGDILSSRIYSEFRGQLTTDFEPFVGTISFNSNSDADYSFDISGPASGKIDFVSTALHEIGHVLGIGTSGVFDSHISAGAFAGPNSLEENGGVPIPLEPSGAHILDGYSGDTALMDPRNFVGTRQLPTDLDLALLADIGYEISGFSKQGQLPEIVTNGNDQTVFGTVVNDTIDGLAGDDKIQGDRGDDHLMGNLGDDILFGQAGEDTLDGGEDDDILYGGEGADTLVGGSGDDIMWGEEGADSYLFSGSTGVDKIIDFDFSEDKLVVGSGYGFNSVADVLAAVSGFYGNASRVTFSPGNWVDVFDNASGNTLQADNIILNEDTSAILDTAEEIFAAEGKLAFFADLALGAYHLAGNEPKDETGKNLTNPASDPAYERVASSLFLFDVEDLPSLEHSVLDIYPNDGWHDGLRSTGADQGIYTFINGAALVGRSDDAIFLSFRGTNSELGLDHAHWLNRSGHFNKIKPLLEAIRDYVEERNAAGEGIAEIYLTGHSLGAAMVQPAYEWLQDKLPSIKIEGLTFASPGYGLDLLDIDDDPSVNITNFWNALDIIQLGAEHSEILGETYTFNNVLENLLDGVDPLTAHSMELYQEIAGMLLREGNKEVGVSLDLADLSNDLLGKPVDRISASIQVDDDGSFSIGSTKDFVMAGLFEYSFAALKLLTSPLKVGITWAKSLLTGAALVVDVVSEPFEDPNVENGMDFGNSFWEGIKDTLSHGLEILYSASGLKFLAEGALELATSLFESDLLVGGARSDILFGLGGKDAIFGGSGNDSMFGGWGHDELFGGDGNDILDGGRGSDQMNGGDGNDVYFINDVDDNIFEHSNEGTDTVISTIDYTLPDHVERLSLDGGIVEVDLYINGTGNALDNIIVGDMWRNKLTGLDGRDVLYGDTGKDTLSGGKNGDFLFGGPGKDKLIGGKGHDVLDGGNGRDILKGGAGADVFVFSKSAEVDDDLILDFGNGSDVIDLSRIAAETSTELSFSGASGFSDTAGEIVFKQKSSLTGRDYTQVRVDIDGDGRSDFEIELFDHYDLTNDNFLL